MTEIDTTGEPVEQHSPTQPGLDVQLTQEPIEKTPCVSQVWQLPGSQDAVRRYDRSPQRDVLLRQVECGTPVRGPLG